MIGLMFVEVLLLLSVGIVSEGMMLLRIFFSLVWLVVCSLWWLMMLIGMGLLVIVCVWLL